MIISVLLNLLLSFRFVSLVPSVTEIFYLLSAEDSLLAISYYCNYPEATKEKFKVGDLLNPDYEKIISLKPDFVIISLPMQKQVEQNLKKLKINYIAFNPESVYEILTVIDSIGKLTGKVERAKFVVDSLKNVLKDLKPLPSKPKVYIELSENPIYTVGKSSFINEIVELAGGMNIFCDKEISYFSPSQEEIVKRNAEIILLLYPDANPVKVSKRYGWKTIKAVKAHNIFALNPDQFTRPGPRVFGATLKLNRLLQSCF
ncbi:MAG: ABC transporter substrate-binding protein [bacterium]|nr:ABC transporter substrate-binding protein [bacterium]